MLDLAHRIVTMKVHVHDDDYFFASPVLLDAIKRHLPILPKIRIDNVYEFAQEETTKNFRVNEMVNIIPPFPNFWCEWFEKDSSAQVGFFVHCQEPEDFYEMAKLDRDKIFVAASKDGEAKWIVQMTPFLAICRKSAFFGSLSPGVPRALPFIVHASISAAGNFIDGNVVFRTKMTDYTPEEALDEREVAQNVVSAAITVFLGLSFMNCKNIKTREHKEGGSSPKFNRQHKTKDFTFKTLEIVPFKSVAAAASGGGEANGSLKGWHICRGHTKTYTEEAPLFGKYAGTFYIPAHAKGSKAHGEIVKDYSVNPMQGE